MSEMSQRVHKDCIGIISINGFALISKHEYKHALAQLLHKQLAKNIQVIFALYLQ